MSLVKSGLQSGINSRFFRGLGRHFQPVGWLAGPGSRLRPPLFFEGMRSGAHALLSSAGPRARSLDRKHVSPNPQPTGEIWCLIVPLALSS